MRFPTRLTVYWIQRVSLAALHHGYGLSPHLTLEALGLFLLSVVLDPLQSLRVVGDRRRSMG